jgi:Zinc knuckle
MADPMLPNPSAEPPTLIASMERRINAFDPVNSSQAEVNQILKQVLLRSNLQGTELVEELKEDLNSVILSKPDVLSSPSLFRNIRDTLIAKNVPNLPYGRGHPIVQSVFRCLYHGEDDEIDRAIEAFLLFSASQTNHHLERPTTPNQTETAHIRLGNNFGDGIGAEERRANSIASRFKDHGRTFSGRLDENLDIKLRNYEEAARENKLSEEQRSQLIYHVLSGEAQDFYFDHIKHCHVTYADRRAALEKEYCSSARQGRARAHLKSARVTTYIAQAQGDVLKGITALYDDISKYAPQCPPDSRTDIAKRRFLEDSIAGYSWSRDSVARAEIEGNPEHTFNGLFQSSCANIQQEIKAAKAVQADTDMGRMGINPSSSTATSSVMYGQRYATPRAQKKPPPRYISSTPSKRSKTCWKCGEEGHFVANCPRKDLSLTDVARGRLKTSDDDRSATRILFELVSGLDADSSQEEEDDQTEAATYFDELVEAQQRDQNFR